MSIVRPLHNNVVLKPIEEEEKMYGNILVPDMGKEKPMMGKVLYVGPGTRTMHNEIIPMSVKIGEVVLYPAFGGTRISYKGEEFIIVKDADILGVAEE